MSEKGRIFAGMIKAFVFTLCVATGTIANAQYYYKDVISTRQTSDRLKKYKSQRIKEINIISFEYDGGRTEDFTGKQIVSDNYTKIKTVFNTALTGSSELATFFDQQDRLIKSIDTADGMGSVSEYKYDEKGRLSSIVNVSTSPGMHQEKEEHLWHYDNEGRPERMIRIKNNADTTFVSFVMDGRGNVIEENSRRGGLSQPAYYYYYDAEDQLTDIVTYNRKAKRLLPIYVFEYMQSGEMNSMLVVPEGSDDYQRWVYEYNAAGLKSKETCYNKRRQVLGRIEYVYGR